MREVHHLHVACIGERRAQVLGLGCLPPLQPRVHEVGAKGLRHSRPPLAEVSGREDELPIARRGQVGDRRLECARPRGREHQDVVPSPVDLLEPHEAALVDLAEVALAVVDDRFRELCKNLRGHRSWPGSEQVALLGHRV